MKYHQVLLLASVFVTVVTAAKRTQAPEPTTTPSTGGGTSNAEVLDALANNQELIKTLNNTVRSLARQLVLSRLYLEEKTRSEGDSGIKQIRMTSEGTRPYHATSHIGYSFAAIHDHADNIRTIGMGELIAVMNGIEFRTRHNDYRLYKPSTTAQTFHAVEDVEFPSVPPAVTSKATIQEQILEMREWFKAWNNQDYSVRDYRPYFKPVISYMEGAWFYSDDQVDESFFSDRHEIDAKEWFELEEKVRFLSYSGAKDSGENIPFLPKVIINVTDENKPIFAQWNYRILAHPLSRDLPLNRLRVVDDLKGRMMYPKTYEDYKMSKMARFSLNAYDVNTFRDRAARNVFLQEIMAEIPGKNNYQGSLTDYGYDGLGKTLDGTANLNAAYYHRRYSVQRDASGFSTRNRGFADQNLYMALTTHPEVVGMENMKCTTGESECPTEEHSQQKWTYAIPMEIIYLTPLHSWNPYNIPYKGKCWTTDGKTVTTFPDGSVRDGTEDNPFDGSCHSRYFLTPSEFFEWDEVNPDPADSTPPGTVFVLDGTGTKRGVRSSGTRIFFPEINGVGILRQRFPITPVHGEGSGVWKELEALQDILLRPNTYSYMFHEQFSSSGGTGGSGGIVGDLLMKMSNSNSASTTTHTHTFSLTENQRAMLNNGDEIIVETNRANEHSHRLTLKLDTDLCKAFQLSFKYTLCGSSGTCWDNHGPCVMIN